MNIRVFRSMVLALAAAAAALPQANELRFCLRSDPKTFHPLLVADDASETVRYLTGGVLIRLNRLTQKLDPELATSWQVRDQGRQIVFRLRQGVQFSDGSRFDAEDVAHTVRALMDPALHSPTGDSFRSGSGAVDVTVLGPYQVSIRFSAPVAGLERLFDQVAIMSARSAKKEMAVLGPFFVSEHQAGAMLVLARNPWYWKRDSAGRQLPYLDTIRLTIQQNREIELTRFRRGELHVINNVDPEVFDRLASESASQVYDAGPSLDGEMLWFNQVTSAPLPEYKKAWFRDQRFRRAISRAVNRDDLCRIVYRGHARPAAGPVSPANRTWFHDALKPDKFDPETARKELARAGFKLDHGVLRDAGGNVVEFSLITNAGNRARERMAAMLQQDLRAIGVNLNVVPLDFQSLIERITRTFAYESCLLGLTNTDLDPNGVMNVWLSSAANHQWNPNQKTPATAWEAEVDRLMRAQASVGDERKRKSYFDKVQEIAQEQAPFVFLVYKSALSAVAPALKNSSPAALRPQTFWNAERLAIGGLPKTRIIAGVLK